MDFLRNHQMIPKKEIRMAAKNEVLYCGDATLETGACYLGGVMTLSGIGFDYVEMEAPFPAGLLERDYKLIILSDYPSRNFPPGTMKEITRKVERGASLLMIGGWESFHGLIGGYQSSDLVPVLPVECLTQDDRLNWCQGLVPEVVSPHSILEGLPWDEPPVVCGCNRVNPKPDAKVILTLRKLQIKNGNLSLGKEPLPLLVLGTYGQGKTGAVTTDFAPHWVGGMVDWGVERVTAQAKGGKRVEVGNHYVTFIRNLLRYFLK
jgi:uncharacterized membrane protein